MKLKHAFLALCMLPFLAMTSFAGNPAPAVGLFDVVGLSVDGCAMKPIEGSNALQRVDPSCEFNSAEDDRAGSDGRPEYASMFPPGDGGSDGGDGGESGGDGGDGGDGGESGGDGGESGGDSGGEDEDEDA